MKSWLREHLYAVRQTLAGFGEDLASTLANLVVLALALSLPLLAWAAWASLEPLARTLPTQPEVTVFLKLETSREQAFALQERLESDPSGLVAEVTLLEREQALERLRADPAWATALDALNSNPLPDALRISLARVEGEPLQLEDFINRWQALAEVDQIVVDAVWVQRLEALLRFLHTGVLFMALVVGAGVISTVFNTVRLQALARQQEIAVERLVGATESFVRRPFIYLGSFMGMLAAIGALVLLHGALVLLNDGLRDLAATYSSDFQLRPPAWDAQLLFLLATAALGALAARLSVTRHTRF